MTHGEILLLIVGLLAAVGVGFVAFILNEILIDIKELRAMIEER